LHRLALAALIVCLATIGQASASSITYNILDMSANQSGYTVRGTITTDGEIGNLANSDITAWSVTISLGVNTETFTSSDGGPIVNILNNLVATPSEIYLLPADNFALANDFGLLSVPSIPNPISIDQIRWVNSPQPIYMAQANFASPPVWNTSPLVAGTNWDIATAAVPEPSAWVLGGIAAFAGLGVWARRRLIVENRTELTLCTATSPRHP
jgi:hypothetical protein